VSEIEDAVDAADELAPLTDAIAAALPPGWKLETLGSLCEKSQYGWTTKADKDGQGVKFLRTTDITPGVVDWERVPFCVEAPPDLEKYLIREGDLLISRTGSIGVNYLVSNPEPAVFASYLIRFRPKKSISTKYLRYYLQSPTYWRAIAAGKKGIAVQNVNATMLSKIPVPVAPDSEQLEIVAELDKQFSRLDEAVANLQRVKTNLKRYKASVLKDAVEGRLVETEATLAHREGRTYETGEQLLQRILEERRVKWTGRGKWKAPESPTADTTLPEGWTWVSVDQLADVGTGATPKRDRAAYWNDGDVPWVTSSVVNAYYVDEASECVTTLALAESNLTLYPIGTLLIAMYGEGKTRGKCAELRIPAATNQALAALQVDVSIRGYLRHFLELNYEEMRKVASGGVQPNLNLSVIRAVCVPLPPLPEQVRIVAEVDRHLSIIHEVEAEVDASLKRAQILRQSTLYKQFNLN
jgi:type I restriction enzyme, S subunit